MGFSSPPSLLSSLPAAATRDSRSGLSAWLSQPFPRLCGTHRRGWSGRDGSYPGRGHPWRTVLGCPPCPAAFMPSCSLLGARGSEPLVTPGRCLTTMDGAILTGLVASPVTVDQDSCSWVGGCVLQVRGRWEGGPGMDAADREQQTGTQPSLTSWNTHMGPPRPFCPRWSPLAPGKWEKGLREYLRAGEIWGNREFPGWGSGTGSQGHLPTPSTQASRGTSPSGRMRGEHCETLPELLALVGEPAGPTLLTGERREGRGDHREQPETSLWEHLQGF